MGYVQTEYAKGGTKLEVPLLGKMYPATILADPPIRMAHIRAKRPQIADDSKAIYQSA